MLAPRSSKSAIDLKTQALVHRIETGAQMVDDLVDRRPFNGR
jgi:hypothetical protein